MTLLASVICLSWNLVSAQDKLFTQAFAHPVDLNPSFAGQIEGRYRVTAAYRDQWRGFIESPFTTIGAYGDIRVNLLEREDDFFRCRFRHRR